MKNRFHSPSALIPGTTVELTGGEFHHAVRVSRVAEGEEVELFDGAGKNVVARVKTIGRAEVVLEVIEEAPRRESPLAIDLAPALIQPERFELVLQKGCELGVRRFTPLLTARCEVRPERVAGKKERWQKILTEAAKQSGRSMFPELSSPVTFDRLLETPGLLVMFDADAPAGTLPSSFYEVTLLIGPEGGWSAGEVELAVSRGVVIQRLGPRRLRAETAALAAVTMIASRFGDLRD